MEMSESESDVTSVGFDVTELSLRPPGAEIRPNTTPQPNSRRGKRGLILAVDSDMPRGINGQIVSGPPAATKREEVVGWPPVRYRKKAAAALTGERRKYVKVAADGAAFLRKLDVCSYGGYGDFFLALRNIFPCFSIPDGDGDDSEKWKVGLDGGCNDSKKWKVGEGEKGTEYAATYEDKDGDLMLVGDVPWKMFIESCKRIRLMKSGEAMGLETSTKSNMT